MHFRQVMGDPFDECFALHSAAPGGSFENSPAVHCWVQIGNCVSPEGMAEPPCCSPISQNDRVQENLIRGGVSDFHRDRRGKLRLVRALRGIDSKAALPQIGKDGFHSVPDFPASSVPKKSSGRVLLPQNPGDWTFRQALTFLTSSSPTTPFGCGCAALCSLATIPIAVLGINDVFRHSPNKRLKKASKIVRIRAHYFAPLG